MAIKRQPSLPSHLILFSDLILLGIGRDIVDLVIEMARLLHRVSNKPLPIASWYSSSVKLGQRSESVSVSSTQRAAGPVFSPLM